MLFALKFVISNFFPRVFGVVALRKAQGEGMKEGLMLSPSKHEAAEGKHRPIRAAF